MRRAGTRGRHPGRILAGHAAGHRRRRGGFYGFDAKYLDDTVSATIPAPLDEETTRRVQQLAIETYRALDCTGLARVDFFVTDAGPVLNETNTMPGFTPISMYPQMFLADGVSYADLLTTLVSGARRH